MTCDVTDNPIPTCLSCRWWLRTSSLGGLCRVNAPIGDPRAHYSDGLVAKFPATREWEGCGQHKHKHAL